jgi:hypothetical protein
MKKLNHKREAKRILEDILEEFSPIEVSVMTEQQAQETVECYSFGEEDTKKIAAHLFELAQSIY